MTSLHYRGIVGMVNQCVYACGIIGVAGIMYLVKDFRILHFIMAAIVGSSLFYLV